MARAEGTLALKTLHMQQWQSLQESASALEIQQQELALAQKKVGEKARFETLRLEKEAAVTVAKAQAIDTELCLVDNQEPEHLNRLPVEDPVERTEHFVNSQQFEEPNLNPVLHTTCPTSDDKLSTLQRQRSKAIYKKFRSHTLCIHPKTQTPPADSSPNVMGSYIQFMARRELIANKIQKFDDNPRN